MTTRGPLRGEQMEREACLCESPPVCTELLQGDVTVGDPEDDPEDALLCPVINGELPAPGDILRGQDCAESEDNPDEAESGR